MACNNIEKMKYFIMIIHCYMGITGCTSHRVVCFFLLTFSSFFNLIKCRRFLRPWFICFSGGFHPLWCVNFAIDCEHCSVLSFVYCMPKIKNKPDKRNDSEMNKNNKYTFDSHGKELWNMQGNLVQHHY